MSSNAKNNPSLFKLNAIGALTTNSVAEKTDIHTKMSTSLSDLRSKLMNPINNLTQSKSKIRKENSQGRKLSIGADLPDSESDSDSSFESRDLSIQNRKSSRGKLEKLENSWSSFKSRSERNLNQSFKMPLDENLSVGSSVNKLYNSSPAIGSSRGSIGSSSPPSSSSSPSSISLTEAALKNFQTMNSFGNFQEENKERERKEDTRQLKEFSDSLRRKQHREAPSLSDSLQSFAECEARFVENRETMMKKTSTSSLQSESTTRFRSCTDLATSKRRNERSTVNGGIFDVNNSLEVEKELRRTKSLSSMWKNTWEISPFYWNEDLWRAERNLRKMSVDNSIILDDLEGDLEDNSESEDPFQYVTSSPSLKSSQVSDSSFSEDKKDLLVLWKDGKEIVEGGSFEALLMRMIEEETIDQEFVLDFIYSFPSFVRPQTMLDELQRLFIRYGSTINQSQRVSTERSFQELMQLRILNIIEKWLHFAFPDFEDKKLLDQLIEFIEGPVKNQLEESWYSWLQSIIQQKTNNLIFTVNSSSSIVLVEATMRRKGTLPLKLVKKKNQHYECMSGSDIVDWIQYSFYLEDRKEAVVFAVRMHKSHLLLNVSKKFKEFHDDPVSFYQFRNKFRSFDPPPKRLIPKKCPDHIKLLDVDPKEMARQLTLITEELFHDITSRNLIEHVWTDKAGVKTPKAIVDFTQRFNDVSNWVATEILLSGNISQRCATISRFVDCAFACFKLKNLSDMISILCGLNHSTILRLKKTWSVLSAKTKKDLSFLEGYSPAYQGKLRELHKNGTSPFIPYLGLFVGDLIRLNESPHLISGTSFINFSKRRVQSKLFRQLDSYKERNYVLKKVPEYLNWLKHVILIISDEKVLMRHSLNCEPVVDE